MAATIDPVQRIGAGTGPLQMRLHVPFEAGILSAGADQQYLIDRVGYGFDREIVMQRTMDLLGCLDTEGFQCRGDGRHWNPSVSRQPSRSIVRCITISRSKD